MRATRNPIRVAAFAVAISLGGGVGIVAVEATIAAPITPVESASAHDNAVNLYATCTNYQWVLHADIVNDYGLTETVTSSTDQSLFATDTTTVSIAVNGTISGSEIVAAPVDETLTINSTWSDNYSRSDQGSISKAEFKGDCTPPPGVATASASVGTTSSCASATVETHTETNATLTSNGGVLDESVGAHTAVWTKSGNNLFPAGPGVSADRTTYSQDYTITAQTVGDACVVDCPAPPTIRTVTPATAATDGWASEGTDPAPTYTVPGLNFNTPLDSDFADYFNGSGFTIPLNGLAHFSFTIKGKAGVAPQAALKLEGVNFALSTAAGGYGTANFELLDNGVASGDGTYHTYVLDDNSIVWVTHFTGDGSQGAPKTLLWLEQNNPNALVRVGLGQGHFNAGGDSTVSSISYETGSYGHIKCNTDNFTLDLNASASIVRSDATCAAPGGASEGAITNAVWTPIVYNGSHYTAVATAVAGSAFPSASPGGVLSNGDTVETFTGTLPGTVPAQSGNPSNPCFVANASASVTLKGPGCEVKGSVLPGTLTNATFGSVTYVGNAFTVVATVTDLANDAFQPGLPTTDANGITSTISTDGKTDTFTGTVEPATPNQSKNPSGLCYVLPALAMTGSVIAWVAAHWALVAIFAGIVLVVVVALVRRRRNGGATAQ